MCIKYIAHTGLYIHIPFCRSRCLYCAFYSTIATGDYNILNRYIDALLSELSERKDEITHPISTIYLGGGTPSVLNIDMLKRLINGIKKQYPTLWQPKEFTIELNPDDVNRNYVESLINLGVTRMSLGIQSFNDQELKHIGRRHSASTAKKACEIILTAGANLSIDLICGLPQQTKQTWQQTVNTALSIKPHHISAYMLELEDNSVLTKLYQDGKIDIPNEETTTEMYTELCNQLSSQGYQHYEISNFCLPNRYSRHNTSYWDGTPYIGLGPGACSYDGKNKRRENGPSLTNYLSHFESVISSTPYYTEENLDRNQLKTEYILTHLRCSTGIDVDDFQDRFGQNETDALILSCQSYFNSGDLINSNHRIALSSKGILISDRIIAAII